MMFLNKKQRYTNEVLLYDNIRVFASNGKIDEELIKIKKNKYKIKEI